MRIISGKYKGRIIKIPKGIRPTQDKVRKAIFDILGDITGLSFLELFAGSGAVGLEALSQGAKEAVFVESGPAAVKIIKENLLSLPCPDGRVIAQDALRAVKELGQRKEKFDIIFLDPPYYQGLTKKALQSLGGCDILTAYGLVAAQHFKKDNLPEGAGDLALFKQARYGDTVLSFYRRAPQ
jgi:16S rRNA (guanine(966)-N(2))-methyltransferase RsmD